jgi:hypothetical protein
MINGLNQDLEVDTARSHLMTLFSEKFPKSKVVSIHVLRERNSADIEKVYQKLEACKEKI